jgi:hypothetical protein
MKPIEEVLFRCSNWSFNDTKKGQHLPRNGSSNKRITQEKLTGLNANGNKVKFEGKPEELSEQKRDAPPELSETAKAFVRKVC